MKSPCGQAYYDMCSVPEGPAPPVGPFSRGHVCSLLTGRTPSASGVLDGRLQVEEVPSLEHLPSDPLRKADSLFLLGPCLRSCSSVKISTIRSSTEFRLPLGPREHDRQEDGCYTSVTCLPKRDGLLLLQQYLEIGKDEVSLNGMIYPEYRGELGQLDRMCEEAEAGAPLLMTDSTGRMWGRWVIQRVEEAQRFFSVSGTPRKVEFRLQLSLYGEDT